ncbi:MAG: extracellular solute-binding protein [Rhodocyclaceae bacterium]|nr:MAG: extracellular solute-binding protein [Rhodocyclaceae bacterium]
MLRIGCMLLLLVGLGAPAQARDEIILRHALSGKALDALATLVLRFNDEQKGKATVLLQGLSGLDEDARRQIPHLALLDADDSAEFFGTRPRFKMLYQVMAESGERFGAERFFPLIADAVDDTLGRLQALPLGLSLPVLMWNKDAFRKAGLDPEQAPKTWWEVQERAGSLYDAGIKCPFTSSRFTWVHLENLSSQHGEAFALREKNGATKVALNRLVNVKHIALMASWYKSYYLHYFGSGAESDRKFVAGDCAMLTGASSLYAEASRAGFAVGVTELPYYDDVRDATPSKVLPDGAALWILAGHKKKDYQVAARFVSFMLKPQMQLEWVRATGYLPMTPAAIEALKAVGVAPTLLAAATRRLSERKSATIRAKHGAGLNRMREILNEEIAAVWANAKPAKEALDTATRRFNNQRPSPGQASSGR